MGDDPFLRWGERLLEAPAAALDEILTGRGARGVQQRAEVEDFLADLLDHPAWATRRDALTHGIDEALHPWLLERSRWDLAAIDRFGTRAYAAQLAAALALVARLPLTHTPYLLAEQQAFWDRRLGALRWPGELDLRWSLDQALIQHQHDTRFAPRWFAACDEAAWGSPDWRATLATGLLGLRKLPHPPGSRPERTVAAALARFAVLAIRRGHAVDGERMFRRGVGSLSVLYPRGEAHWEEVWQEVLESLPRGARGVGREQLAGWLGGGARKGHSVEKSGKRRPARAELPTAQECDRLVDRIRRHGRVDGSAWREVTALMARYWAYAAATGDALFTVIALNKLGNSVIVRNPGSEILHAFHRWVLRAIETAPDDRPNWGLWADVLDSLGRTEAALAVRWEAMRRFPEDPVQRTELARSLLDKGHDALAERLLREAVAAFPENAVFPTMLADLLRVDGRSAEAESLLRQTISDFPQNEVCRNMLADLLRVDGRNAEAESLLRQNISAFPQDAVCRTMLADLLRVDGRNAEAESLLHQAISDFPQNEVCRTILVKVLWGSDRKGEAHDLLRETMRDFPRNAVSQQMLAGILWDSGDEASKTEALQILESLERMYPSSPEVRKLATRLRGGEEVAAEFDDEADIPGPADLWEDILVGADDSASMLRDEAATGADVQDSFAASVDNASTPRDEAAFGEAGPITEFLHHLEEQVSWWASYYGEESLDDAPQRAAMSGSSDLALAIVWRQGERSLLESWRRVKPGSYVARLLSAWRDDGGSVPLDPTLLEAVAEEFPEQGHYLRWLRYPVLNTSERQAVIREARREERLKPDAPNRQLWSGRLASVYPNLDDPTGPDATAFDREALRRLVADIAIAGADRAVPAVAL
ncbi:tetratricopeptide repeat protein [Endothiovibrio diazotrophicus]